MPENKRSLTEAYYYILLHSKALQAPVTNSELLLPWVSFPDFYKNDSDQDIHSC